VEKKPFGSGTAAEPAMLWRAFVNAARISATIYLLVAAATVLSCALNLLGMTDGAWGAPTGPVLGMEIDEWVAARHPFEPEVVMSLDAVLADGRFVNW
jgi:hypothetical protein